MCFFLVTKLMVQVGATTGTTVLHTNWQSEDEMASKAGDHEYFGGKTYLFVDRWCPGARFSKAPESFRV